MKTNQSGISPLGALKDSAVSGQMDEVFRSVIKDKAMSTKSAQIPANPGHGEIALEDAGELDIGLVVPEVTSSGMAIDQGMDLAVVSGNELDIGELDEGFNADSPSDDHYGDLSLDGADEAVLADDEVDPDERTVVKSLGQSLRPSVSSDGSSNELTMGAFNLVENDADTDLGEEGGPMDLGDTEASPEIGIESDDGQDLGLDLDPVGPPSAELTLGSMSLGDDLSDEAKKKLEEIDAIMDFDASQVNLSPEPEPELLEQSFESDFSLDMGSDLDESLVPSDLAVDSLNFETALEKGPEEVVPSPPPKESRQKKMPEHRETRDRNLGEDLRELSGAYSGEMERMQATISNLRTDRDELLTRIKTLEEEKVLEKRLTLTLRAELDERKIELTIIRKKLNEEIGDLKDRLKLYDEKRLILEERNRVLHGELDKAAQKTKIDVKKIQLRERELEQKLELLKSDAETQIRNRDLKLLELKRKIDSMEFDMESISQQEKRSVESRFELEDKLEKAVKTLRSAITVLEEDTDRSGVLSALKKNIDM